MTQQQMQAQLPPHSFNKLTYKKEYSNTPPEQIERILNSLSIQQKLKENLLQSETGLYDVQIIVKLIENLFSDKMLYQNKILKKKLLENRKGWIKIQQILNLPQLKNSLSQIQLFHMISRQNLVGFIRIQIKSKSKNLMVNKNYIKRKIPFIDKIKNTKPVYIQNYPEQNKMKTISQILEGITQIYKTSFKIGQQWGYVYAEQPEKIIEYSHAAQKRRNQLLLNSQQQERQFVSQQQQKIKDQCFDVASFEQILRSFPPPDKKIIQFNLLDKAYRPFAVKFKQKLCQRLYKIELIQLRKFINLKDPSEIHQMNRLHRQFLQNRQIQNESNYRDNSRYRQLIQKNFDIYLQQLPDHLFDPLQLQYNQFIDHYNQRIFRNRNQQANERIANLQTSERIANQQADEIIGWISGLKYQVTSDIQGTGDHHSFIVFISCILQIKMNAILQKFRKQQRQCLEEFNYFYLPNIEFNQVHLRDLSKNRKNEPSCDGCRVLTFEQQQEIDNYIQINFQSKINKSQLNGDLDIII